MNKKQVDDVIHYVLAGTLSDTITEDVKLTYAAVLYLDLINASSVKKKEEYRKYFEDIVNKFESDKIIEELKEKIKNEEEAKINFSLTKQELKTKNRLLENEIETKNEMIKQLKEQLARQLEIEKENVEREREKYAKEIESLRERIKEISKNK